MADASLEGMPDFDKPENIPLIVPDTTPITEPLPVKRHCIEKNKAGEPCKVPPLKGGDRCLGHAKSLSPELRLQWSRKAAGIPKASGPITKKAAIKSRDEILGLLSHRLDLITQRYRDSSTPEIEDMICNVCRTMAVVMRVEASEDVTVRGWRMKGAV
jgi:hypothetical protein